MSRALVFPIIMALMVVTAVDCLAAAGPGSLPDHTRTTPESLGIKPVKPQKDTRTGFVVGGKNTTALIRKLTEIAGRPIAELERDMRPEAGYSTKGFLGKDESLLDILTQDNQYVVDQLGLTHQELARHLHILGNLARQKAVDKPLDITYHGGRFRLKAILFRGYAFAPFEDGTKTNCEATVENLVSGKKISFSLLVPHMVERYGFYEGRGTPYRVDPKQVLEVLDFILKKATTKDTKNTK
jgi:hypothetical protein